MREPFAYLADQVQAASQRRDWKALPADFARDAVKALGATFRPHLRGNRYIKARVALAQAQTFGDLDRVLKIADGGSDA